MKDEILRKVFVYTFNQVESLLLTDGMDVSRGSFVLSTTHVRHVCLEAVAAFFYYSWDTLSGLSSLVCNLFCVMCVIDDGCETTNKKFD